MELLAKFFSLFFFASPWNSCRKLKSIIQLNTDTLIQFHILISFIIFSTALSFQMMDERFPLDNGPDMTNHQENCTRTPAEVSCWTLTDVLCCNLTVPS